MSFISLFFFFKRKKKEKKRTNQSLNYDDASFPIFILDSFLVNSYIVRSIYFYHICR